MVEALQQGDLSAAPLDESLRTLLEFVGQLTESPAETTDADVERLREAGFDDQQIAEAVYITALFAFFNRVADAFGLQESGFRDLDVSPEAFDHGE